MKKLLLILLCCVVLGAGFVMPSQAQTDTPIVYAVLFYSPTCPHCHQLITEDLPPITEEFGENLEVVLINVRTPDGNQLSRAAYEKYQIPQDRWVVPMMVVDDRVLIGGAQIPAELPNITRDGIARGGIPLPDLPGLAEAYAAANPEAAANASQSGTDDAVSEVAEELTLSERLALDPVANTVAIIVLIGLIISIVLLILPKINPQFSGMQPVLNAARLTALFTMLVVLSIVLNTNNDTLAIVASWGVLSLIATSLVILLVDSKYQGYVIPLVIIAGLMVAFYLSYVELTQNAAACGVVGDCNAVQQSEYAVLFGMLPVGVLGIFGYSAILVAWFIADRRDEPMAHAALAIMTLGGVLFSIYLTFLEPFVIGATCAWCLTSALTMLLLAWLLAPKGLSILFGETNQQEINASPESA